MKSMFAKTLFIQRTAFHLPDRIVTNDDLGRENPSWNVAKAVQTTGVHRRHIAAADETAFDLALQACRKLIAAGPAPTIDALIFCTQSPDYVLPSNAFLLHKTLGLPETCLAFDYNLACSGYVYGLAIAQGFVSAGLANNILLVTADTYSKMIHPLDRSARLVFGDAAAASLLSADGGCLRVIDVLGGTAGSRYDTFIIPAGGMRTPRTPEAEVPVADPGGSIRSACHINMDGREILSFVNSAVPGHIRRILERNGLQTSDIDCYIFHQASKIVLDSLTRLLDLNPEKVFVNVDRVGNTVSSSIPIALKEMEDAGRIKPGNKILLCGFGAGLSWASALVEV